MANETQVHDDPDMQPAEGEVIDATESVALDRLPNVIREHVVSVGAFEEESAEDVQRRIAERILDSETVDQVLSPSVATPWRSMLGTPVVVLGLTWRRSSFDESAGVYAIVEAANPATGEPLTLTTGSFGVMVQLFKLWQMGALPATLQLLPLDKRTARGFEVFYLQKA